MTTVSPPKPWERANSTAIPSSAPTTTAMTAATGNPITSPSSTTGAQTTINTPTLPDRPSTLNSVVNQTASNYSAYGQNRFAGPYASSGYGSIGGMYGGAGGGYGNYGGNYGMGSYGGYGGGMYNRPYGGGFGGMPGQDPNNPQSLTATWNQSTAATFQIMESIVGAFGGFAQMLESAYMTTHSSFFAMVSMAEQLGNLRQTLGQVLGIYTLLRWMRTLLAKVTGRPPPADATSLTPANFSSFVNGGASGRLPDGSPAPPRASKKPFIMFAVAVFGLPYLMSKLIRSLARAQEAEEQKRLQEQGIVLGPDGQQRMDPSKLDFCRALYDYKPAEQSVGLDLEVKKGDLIAVLSKTDPLGNPSEWWKCRSREGKVGYLPSPYLQRIERRPQLPALPQAAEPSHSLPGSRTMTMKEGDVDHQRTKSLSSAAKGSFPS